MTSGIGRGCVQQETITRDSVTEFVHMAGSLSKFLEGKSGSPQT